MITSVPPRLDGCCGLPFDLRRPPLVVLHDEADRVAAVRARPSRSGTAMPGSMYSGAFVYGRIVLDRAARATFDREERRARCPPKRNRGAASADSESFFIGQRGNSAVACSAAARGFAFCSRLSRRPARRPSSASSSYASRLLIDGTRSSSAAGSRRGGRPAALGFERGRLELARRSPTSCS